MVSQLQCISSTLYSLSQSIAWLQSGELRIAEITRKCEQILCPGTFILFISINGCLQFFLHIFSKKFWLQFICNKLISTTEKSKNHCAQLQCISSTLYSLSQSIAWLQSGELRIAEILQTDGRADIMDVYNFFYTFLAKNSDYNLFVIN
jgi:hypothetical protein